jgi:hypothetical protein
MHANSITSLLSGDFSDDTVTTNEVGNFGPAEFDECRGLGVSERMYALDEHCLL